MIKLRPNKPIISGSTRIWRYMDLLGLLDLIQNSELRFTQLAQFDDGFEGRISNEEIKEDIRQKEIAGIPTHLDGQIRGLTEVLNRYTNYASCWTLNEPDSMMMWSIYAPNSQTVAIETDIGGIMKFAGDKDPEIIAGFMEYGDRENGILNAHNHLDAIWAKWDYYAHERELRFLVSANALELDMDEGPVQQTPKYAKVKFNKAPVSRILANPRMSDEDFDSINKVLEALNTGHKLERTKIKIKPSGNLL